MARLYMNCHIHMNVVEWPQWWSFDDVSQQGLDFSKKIIKMKIIFWFDFHRCSHGFSKNDNYKKPSSKLIFFNEKKIRKIRMIFDIENWLWKSDLGTFWRPMWTSVKVKSKNYFSFTDFFAKIKPLLTHVCKTPPLRSH